MKTKLGVVDYMRYEKPLFYSDSNKDWVFFGEDNLYPNYLDDLFISSSIHGAIVTGSADMIYGEGLDSDGKDDNVDQWLKLKGLFRHNCLKRAAFDLKLYGNAYLQVIWSQDRSVISEVYHVPASTIRCGKADDNDQVEIYYHSTNWMECDKSTFKPTPIPRFNTSDRTAPSQILHIKSYSPVSFFYGLPDYAGATSYIELDKNIAEFHLQNIKNGLFPSMVLSFNGGIPTDDERRDLERLIYDKFGGASNAGKILMTFNDGQDSAPTVEPFNLANPHDTYDFLAKQTFQEILSGHRVTSPLLFGLRSEGGGFGSNADEMKDAYDLYSKTVIEPFQNILLEGIEPLLATNSIILDVYFKDLVPASFMEQKAEEEEVKKKIFSEQPVRITETQGSIWLNHLADKDAPLPKEFFLLKEEVVNDTSDDKRLHTKYEFGLEDYSNYDLVSDWGDVVSPQGNLFAVRYQYFKATSKQPVGDSRDFCIEMMDLAQGGVQYRYEDIANMSSDGVNGQFAAAGQSTYDIFEWAGGKNCYHGWKRLIYVYVPDGLPDTTDGLYEDWDDVMQRVGNNPYVVQKGDEAIAPIDKQ